jgi:hypothetical protein
MGLPSTMAMSMLFRRLDVPVTVCARQQQQGDPPLSADLVLELR